MEIVKTFNYKGRFAAELANGDVMVSNGSMYLAYCKKVEEGLLVVESEIVASMMMRTMEDFAFCVKNCDYQPKN